MYFRIQLEDDDFNALRNNKGHCPFARAIARAIPSANAPKVDSNFVSFSDVSTRTRFTFVTPRKAAEGINEYDVTGNKAAFLKDSRNVMTLSENNLYSARPMARRNPRVVGEGTVDNTPKALGKRKDVNERIPPTVTPLEEA